MRLASLLAWISELLNQVLSEVKQQCRDQDRETHWHVFNERVVQPLLHSVAPRSLAEICQAYGIESEKKASNMIITVKRRFQVVLKQAVRDTVASEAALADELQDIMQFLPKGSGDAQHSQ